MGNHRVREILEECQAILKGHFVLASGGHSGEYLEKANICKYPVLTGDLCWEIATGLSQLRTLAKKRIEVVAGLAPIGVVLANRVAEHLGEFYEKEVIAVFTEKNEKGEMVFERGYEKEVIGKNVLIVDDILTTGGSVAQVIKEVERLGGRIVAVAVICQRGEIRAKKTKEVLVFALLELEIKDWPPESCPLCKEEVPITKTK